MIRYKFPKGLRYSTLEEREEFYENEFDLNKVEEWLKDSVSRPVFAIIMGKYTRIYLKKYEEDASTTILIDEYEDLGELKDWIIEFLPEAVYYDRNIYSQNGKVLGQELVFDVDPENVICPIHGSLEKRMRLGQGLSFCKIAFSKTKHETAELYKALLENFSKIKIVYSGRGFHIHILDKDAFYWSIKQRKKLALELKEFPIDEWVTSGGMKLIRLPYSLHGMVSRIVTPLDYDGLLRFDLLREERIKPAFLSSKGESVTS